MSPINKQKVGTLEIFFNGNLDQSGSMTVKKEDISQFKARPVGIYFDGLGSFFGKLLFEHEEISLDDQYQIANLQRYQKGKYSFTIEYSQSGAKWKDIKGVIDYHLEKPNTKIDFLIIVTEYTDGSRTYISEYSSIKTKDVLDIVNNLSYINFGSQYYNEKSKPADLIDQFVKK